ncbi:hypothetical protein ACJX0J_016184, partial [Zea mays]
MNITTEMNSNTNYFHNALNNFSFFHIKLCISKAITDGLAYITIVELLISASDSTNFYT